MLRRDFLIHLPLGLWSGVATARAVATDAPEKEKPSPTWDPLDPALVTTWRTRWQQRILSDSRDRTCDRELGEELGWLVSPFLEGFYYGYLATEDAAWLERLIDWADACLVRGVKEPDGFLGWPKGNGSGGESKDYTADSLLGEAMMMRPLVLAAGVILKNPTLKARWERSARNYLSVSEELFRKWDSRGAWREVEGGGVWVVPGYGIDPKTGGWSAGIAQRGVEGFSHPANKQNHIARWLLAHDDVTPTPIFRERARQWFQVMKSRMRLRESGRFYAWNYWDPAGPWDYTADHQPRHWVGVHPNGGYYQIDVAGIVAAYEHGLVFRRADLDRLIATQREFMWNQQLTGAQFRRIDGGDPDPRWKNSPGLLWTALVPYDAKLRAIFLANHDPASWSGLSTTPWFLSLNHA